MVGYIIVTSTVSAHFFGQHWRPKFSQDAKYIAMLCRNMASTYLHMPSWPQDCAYYFVFLHVSHCFTDGVGGSDCWQHPTKNRQHEIITSWWRLSPPKKKQNKLQDEAKSLPTKSKQTNRYTNKPNHPWTPNHFGIFNFSKRILEKKKNTHVPKFQRFSGCPTSKKRRPTDSHFHCRTWRTLQRMVAPLVFESSLPKCESFHRYVGMLSHSL